jgi:hypothetical protein
MDKMLKPDELILVENADEHPSDTKYCFTWSSFKVIFHQIIQKKTDLKSINLQSHFMDEVGEQLREEKFVDLTIICDHHVFRAHRVILCSASPLLKQLLEVKST